MVSCIYYTFALWTNNILYRPKEEKSSVFNTTLYLEYMLYYSILYLYNRQTWYTMLHLKTGLTNTWNHPETLRCVSSHTLQSSRCQTFYSDDVSSQVQNISQGISVPCNTHQQKMLKLLCDCASTVHVITMLHQIFLKHFTHEVKCAKFLYAIIYLLMLNHIFITWSFCGIYIHDPPWSGWFRSLFSEKR